MGGSIHLYTTEPTLIPSSFCISLSSKPSIFIHSSIFYSTCETFFFAEMSYLFIYLLVCFLSFLLLVWVFFKSGLLQPFKCRIFFSVFLSVVLSFLFLSSCKTGKVQNPLQDVAEYTMTLEEDLESRQEKIVKTK